MLGQYHMRLSGSTEPDGSDIDDPLYGNVGGGDEQVRTLLFIWVQ